MGIIIAVLLFSFIIIFHELGHFLLAKKNGAKRTLLRRGGEGGIRTHVPVKANAFRVRPVMTASILLQKYLNILP